MNYFKKLKNIQQAKQENKERLNDTLYNLSFNDAVDDLKKFNRQVLLNNLIEASGISEHDLFAIVNLNNLIDKAVKDGTLTEFYKRNEV